MNVKLCLRLVLWAFDLLLMKVNKFFLNFLNLVELDFLCLTLKRFHINKFFCQKKNSRNLKLYKRNLFLEVLYYQFSLSTIILVLINLSAFWGEDSEKMDIFIRDICFFLRKIKG